MLFALAISFVMGVVGGSGSALPDVKGFTTILSKELEFRIDDCKTGFVGRMFVYQNPDDPNEFVKIYYRHVAIVSERACEKNDNDIEAGNRNSNSSNQNYHRKDEAEALGRVQQATDAFAYVQWRTVRDPRTGQDIQDGFFDSGLLEQSGNWTFGHGYDLTTSPFSEPVKNNSKKRINVGIQFYLVGATHIVRVDQDNIVALSGEVFNGKK